MQAYIKIPALVAHRIPICCLVKLRLGDPFCDSCGYLSVIGDREHWHTNRRAIWSATHRGHHCSMHCKRSWDFGKTPWWDACLHCFGTHAETPSLCIDLELTLGCLFAAWIWFSWYTTCLLLWLPAFLHSVTLLVIQGWHIAKMSVALSILERQSGHNVVLHHWSMLGFVIALMLPCHATLETWS